MSQGGTPDGPVLGRELALAVVDAGTRQYFADRRDLVRPFIDAHFTIRGTLSLHRSALGWDIARAPLNLTLSAPQIVMQLGARAAKSVGATRVAHVLGRPIMLKTDVERQIEWLVHTELLGLPFRQRRSATVSATPWPRPFSPSQDLETAMHAALAEIGRPWR